MIDNKSLIIGIILGIAVVFSLGASHKKGKKGSPLVGMFQVVAIPNNKGKAISSYGKWRI